AACLACSLIGRAGDIDSHARLDLGMEPDANVVQAKRLDRPVEHDLAAFDGESTLGDRGRDVARGARAIELAGIAGLADDDEAFPLQLIGNRACFRFQLEIARLKLRPLFFEALAIGLGGAQRLALGEEKVACETVLDGDDVAHLAETADALKKDHLHFRHSCSVRSIQSGFGGCPCVAARSRRRSMGSARPRMAMAMATQPRSKMPI